MPERAGTGPARAALAGRPRFMGEFRQRLHVRAVSEIFFLVGCGRIAIKQAGKCCPLPAPARRLSAPQACSDHSEPASETVTMRAMLVQQVYCARR